MSLSKDLFEEGMAVLGRAAAERRVEEAASESRIARLKHALVLERVGRMDEARAIYDEVSAEQAAIKED